MQMSDGFDIDLQNELIKKYDRKLHTREEVEAFWRQLSEDMGVDEDDVVISKKPYLSKYTYLFSISEGWVANQESSHNAKLIAEAILEKKGKRYWDLDEQLRTNPRYALLVRKRKKLNGYKYY